MRKLKLGVAGLGRAYALLEPALARDPRIELAAGADPRPEAEFPGNKYGSVEELCRSADVEAIYIATPHQLHAEHACLAAQHGKHLLVEKPMALTLDECRAMIDAARTAGVALVVGPSHAFDPPVRRAAALVASGAFGALRMVTSVAFTDFLYRPRRPEELDTARGGGALFNQAPHQVDVARLLAGGRVKSVRACSGIFDPSRPTEGAYSALLAFESGAFATLVYSGYAHFDSDELMGWVGEMGQPKDPSAYGSARKALEHADERLLKYGRKATAERKSSGHPHFGLVVASCEQADLRPVPQGVWIYADDERRLDEIAVPEVPRSEAIDELYDAAVLGKKSVHDGEWGMATLAVCLAMLRSAREGKEVALSGRGKNG